MAFLATLQRMLFRTLLSGLIFTAFSATAQAQILVEDSAEAPQRRTKVGKKAARQYFSERKRPASSSRRSPSSDGARHMNIYIGGYLDDKQYRWGDLDREEDVGEMIFGVQYRIGEWVNSMDLFFRGEFQTFDIDSDQPNKLSLMPVIAIPDAKSGFPLYFGVGGGLGIFFSQLDKESDLSLDYLLMTGLRFPQLFGTWGFNFEVGMKGHIHLFSSGQFDGVYYALGAVFEF